VTNSTGEYTLANLPPGTYRIEVEKSGFKKLIRPDVTQHVQDAQGQFSVNGQRTDANYFTVDGASANFGVTG
jgi:Carboxypeptidase regulatory-like domain